MAIQERTETIKVSSDIAARKAGNHDTVVVTFVYENWTEDDYLNRLSVANSPKVSVEALLRKMKDVPASYRYVVPKAGTRTAQDPIAVASSLSIAQIEAILASKKR